MKRKLVKVQQRDLTVCSVLVLHVQLAKSEIAQSDVASIIEENVLRFEITVNDLETVKTFKCAQQLRRVESGTVDVESLLSLQVVEQLSAVDECQNQI